MTPLIMEDLTHPEGVSNSTPTQMPSEKCVWADVADRARLVGSDSDSPSHLEPSKFLGFHILKGYL